MPLVGSSRISSFGIVDDGRGELEPLLHAGRVRLDLAIAGLAEADVVEHLVGPLQGVLAAHADQLAGVGDELDAVDVREQALVLGREADLAADVELLPAEVHAEDLARPLVDGMRPSSVRIIVVLPEPFGPSRPTAPVGHGQREIVEGRDGAVGLGDVFEIGRARATSARTTTQSGIGWSVPRRAHSKHAQFRRNCQSAKSITFELRKSQSCAAIGRNQVLATLSRRLRLRRQIGEPHAARRKKADLGRRTAKTLARCWVPARSRRLFQHPADDHAVVVVEVPPRRREEREVAVVDLHGHQLAGPLPCGPRDCRTTPAAWGGSRASSGASCGSRAFSWAWLWKRYDAPIEPGKVNLRAGDRRHQRRRSPA